MNRKIVSRFLMLGILVCTLTFGINNVSADDFEDCTDVCDYNFARCGVKIGPFIFQPPSCYMARTRCIAACIDIVNDPPIIIGPN